jgi:diketogulonate reductase-like aldo/keto reductase
MDHLESGIKVELNNPLSNNPLLNHPLNNQTPRGKLADVTVHLVEFVCPFCRRVGGTHGVTEAQFCLRWSMQCGIVTIPKSSNAERIKEVTHIITYTL